MTSTIHIFDEFPNHIETYNDSEKHKKRIQLERLVFSHLFSTYSNLQRKYWDSWNAPTQSNKKIVIVERRIHENLEFILHNSAFAGQGDWGLAVVCSDINLEYVQTLCGSKNIQIIPYFKGNPDALQGKQEYNDLLQTSEFYEFFSEEYLCLVEMDCYFRKPIPESVLTCDYIAAPYAWDGSLAGGGLSFRRKSIMIEICKKFPVHCEAQDLYASNGIRELGFTMPPWMYSKEIVAESILVGDPVAVHQWWTFFSPSRHNLSIFERYMTIEIS